MIIKRYLVNSMNEAMTRIRYELGKDAVIISQRKVRKPGFTGLFSKKVIEVTAAVENVKNTESIKTEEDAMQTSIEAIRKAMEKGMNKERLGEERKEKVSLPKPDKNENVTGSSLKSSEDKSASELLKEMKEMKEMINGIMQQGNGIEKKKSEIEVALESNDIEEVFVQDIMSQVREKDNFSVGMQEVRQIVENSIDISKRVMDGVMVLVGPTGVGKTTTIAKLAGRLALLEKKKVGLITVDTYRIGAVEQLKTYADIMNIPFKVVLTLREMESAVESMQECDIILIDTTGRSSKNAMQISELRAFIDKTLTDNIHLVLSCTTKNKDIEAIIEGYRVLNYNNVIITKLDETTTYGSIFNILKLARKPLSYVTTGQNVPDDIKEFTIREVSNLILGEDSIC